MKDKALKIIRQLEKKGFKAYIVGGFVRDYLLKKKSYDIDICTNATPKELKQIFKTCDISRLEYGSVTLIAYHIRFEITTFRKEITYKDNRKPVEIKYIDDLYEDLLRRDFTINTLCMDSKGRIVDMLSVKRDLKEKIIKTVGNASDKLEEDALRILRAIRFATTLDFDLDKDLEKAIIQNKALLKKLSYERKKSELTKIFSSEHKKKGLELIKKFELDKELELINLDYILNTNDIIGVWTIISSTDKYLFTKLEKEQSKKLKQLLFEDLNNDYTLYKYDLYLCTLASDILKLNKKDIINRYNKLPIKNKKDIKINIDVICKKLNKKPGQFIKIMMSDLEEKIINRKLTNTKSSLEKYILKEYNK